MKTSVLNISVLLILLTLYSCNKNIADRVQEIIDPKKPNNVLEKYTRYCDYDNGIICYNHRNEYGTSCVRKSRPICANE